MQDSSYQAGADSHSISRDRFRRDRLTGLAILATAFLAALTISSIARRAAEPKPAPPPAPPDTSGLLNFPRDFDPLSALERARSLSVRSRLQGIVLDGVKSDGTMDLLVSSKLERAPVRFVFNSPKGEGPQPSHPPGTRLRREYCGRQDVQIDRSGIYAVPDQPLTNCHGVGDELPEPHCGLKKIWEYAIKHGAPPDAVAHIEYYSAEAGPAWRFDILSSHTNFVLYGDCERELSPSEAAGSVPH